jgi:hypothetical protein
MGADSSPEEACGALAVERNHKIVKEYQPPNCGMGFLKPSIVDWAIESSITGTPAPL